MYHTFFAAAIAADLLTIFYIQSQIYKTLIDVLSGLA